MSRSFRSNVQGTLSRVAASCILGLALLTTAATIGPAGSALASCTDNSHEGVAAEDTYTTDAYGNKGYIYVNTDTVIESLQDDIYRSIFIDSNTMGWDVEVGWGAGPGSVNGNPQVYYAYEEDGVTIGPYWDYNSDGENLPTDSDQWFRVDNVGDVGIWRYNFDSDSSPFGYSPTLPFNQGYEWDQAERWDTCDSDYTHQYDLSYFELDDGLWYSYVDLVCQRDTTPNYYFHENSVSDWDATTTSSSCP